MNKEEKYRELIEDMLTNLDNDNVDIRDYEEQLKEIDEAENESITCDQCMHEEKNIFKSPCYLCYPLFTAFERKKEINV